MGHALQQVQALKRSQPSYRVDEGHVTSATVYDSRT